MTSSPPLSSSTFLSGEEESNPSILLSSISSTLSSMALTERREDANNNNNSRDNGDNGDNGNNSDDNTINNTGRTNERSKQLIQVIDESSTNPNDNTNESASDDGDDDEDGDGEFDDDQPPPFFDEISNKVQKHTKPKLISRNSSTRSDSDTNSGVENDVYHHNNESSLMEQMMKDAIKAKKKKEDEQIAKRTKESMKMSFGLKKGFLNSASNKSSVKKRRSKKANNDKHGTNKAKLCTNREDNIEKKTNDQTVNDGTSSDSIIYELDKAGNMVPTQDEIPTIRPSKDAKKSNPLQFQEVQDAMLNDLSSSSSSIFHHLSNNQQEWNTPDLSNDISNNKILSSGMVNPKFTAALEAFKTNPKKALEQFKNHPDVVEFLNEFCRVMGNHFVKLDEKQKKGEKKKGVASKSKTTTNDMGPLAQNAIRKETERTKEGGASWDKGMNRQEKERLDAIMADQQLTSLLMDVDLQRVMNECSTLPGKMRLYM